MKTSPIIVLFSTIFLIGQATVAYSADAPAKSPELKVLERFIGTWDEEGGAEVGSGWPVP